jgi:UDP-GlcNAc3NAcA epimerase
MKVVTVLGARPQFIKASVVSHKLRASGVLDEVLVHTGQHFDANMSDVFFSELGMARPSYYLDIHGGTHGAMTGRMLVEVERVLLAEKPDAVLVYGDTNSTLVGALAAVKLHIPVAHIEAGLRSFNMTMPEEVNRILTDRISRWLFTPTVAAEENLRREGVAVDRIVPVGDVMYDVALHHGARIDATGRVMGRLGLAPGGYVLTTVHRAENTDNSARLAAIVNALNIVAQMLPVVWPLHPRTREALRLPGWLDTLAGRVTFIEPVGYLDMVQLEKHAALIATDSGGVQKEAFFYRVPCVTLRNETEWVELVVAGWNRLVPPTDAQSLQRGIRAALRSCGKPIKPYGEGDAAQRIVQRLVQDLGA